MSETKPDLTLSLQETANSIEIQAADGTIVADLINSEDCCVTESMRQYAALFAAAPDMLAALKELKCYYCGFSIMQHVLGGDPERCYGGKDTPRDVIAAIAAIAKAGTQ